MMIRCSQPTRMSAARFVVAVLATVACILLLHNEAHAQVPAVADSVEPIDFNDGPHVFWQNDSTAVVFYWCEGALDTQRFIVSDTLRFAGRCGDKGLEYAIPRLAPEIPPSMYDGVSRVFAVSDLHGEYDYFSDLLTRAGVIDADGKWGWGDGHLVVVGDIFDRGDKVTECLWLVYRLEQEARRDGGQVHFVPGNHELMVLQGDNRYVNDKYLKGIARRSRIRHEDLYGRDTELGRWLRTKHTAVRINGVLFIHGGGAPFLVDRGLDLDALNDSVRAFIDMPSSQLAFSDLPRLLFGSVGPFWYRGYFDESEGRYPRATDEDIERVLALYNADVVVVGHTGVEQVTTLRGGRVIGIDVPFEDLDCIEGLLWEAGQLYRVTGAGERVVLE